MSWNPFLSFTFLPFYFYFQQVILNVTQALQKYQCHYFFFVSFPFKASSCQNCGCQNWQLGTFPTLARVDLRYANNTSPKIVQWVPRGTTEVRYFLYYSVKTLSSNLPEVENKNSRQRNVIFTMTLHRVAVCHSTV